MREKGIQSYLMESLEQLDNLLIDNQCDFISESHHLNGRSFNISKLRKEFTFSTTSTIIKGLQTNKELEFQSDMEYCLENENLKFYVLGRDILLQEIIYLEDDLKGISGTIQAFNTKERAEQKQLLFRRFFLPIESQDLKLHQFTAQPFNYKIKQGRLHSGFRMPITINDVTFYLYTIKYEQKSYAIIESTDKIEIKEFQRICFHILLTMAFLKGNLYHDEAFIFGYENSEMKDSDELFYYRSGIAVITNQPTFTTNIYSFYKNEIDSITDDTKRREYETELNKDTLRFTHEQFSKLAELITNEEKVQRSIYLFVLGHIATLEVRIPNYFVAIEAITAYISKLNEDKKSRLNPIKDKKVANRINDSLVKVLETFAQENNLDNEEFNLEILKRKLNSLNTPPNADKLSESFGILEYELTKEERKILTERNSYLHGSFVKYIDDDEAFSEALYIALRLHFMFAVLVLKSIGFNGKVINYCACWNIMLKRKIKEDKLKLI